MNDTPQITIVTVSFGSSAFLAHLIPNLWAKANSPERLRALIIDNTGGTDEDLAGLELPIPFEVVPFEPTSKHGAVAHGQGLNEAMDHLHTSHALVVDPDVHVFLPGWDDICSRLLRGPNVIAVGAPYPSWKVGKYHHFPSPIFCFFDVKRFLVEAPDWAALDDEGRDSLGVFARRQLARLGGLVDRRRYEASPLVRGYGALAEGVFGVVTRDPGWRIASDVREKNLRAVLFDDVRPGQAGTSLDVEAFQELVRHYEVFLFGDSPALTHKYGSSSPVWRTERSDETAYWYEQIDLLEGALADHDAEVSG